MQVRIDLIVYRQLLTLNTSRNNGWLSKKKKHNRWYKQHLKIKMQNGNKSWKRCNNSNFNISNFILTIFACFLPVVPASAGTIISTISELTTTIANVLATKKILPIAASTSNSSSNNYNCQTPLNSNNSSQTSSNNNLLIIISICHLFHNNFHNL